MCAVVICFCLGNITDFEGIIDLDELYMCKYWQTESGFETEHQLSDLVFLLYVEMLNILRK